MLNKTQHSIINFLAMVSILVVISTSGLPPVTWQYWFVFASIIILSINSYMEGADMMEIVIREVLGRIMEEVENEK